jgi:hypothetical protein
VSGWIKAEVVLLDTNAGGEYIDTTKDSMRYAIYTRCQGDTISKLIKGSSTTDSIIKAGWFGGTPVWFTTSVDSALCDEVFFKIYTAIGDSDHSVVDAGCGVTYKVTVNMVAKQ